MDTKRITRLAMELEGPIAVFGAGGFIGANLVRALLPSRNDVFAVTHQGFIPWRLLGLPKENILQCDVTQPREVERIFQRHACRTLFCFAAYGAYSRQSDAPTIYRTNLLGLINVVEAARHHGISALVHAGSSSEYGTNSAGPSETAALHPNSHYAVSKISASYLIGYLGSQGVPVINLRLYSVYGPWEESDRLIPKLIEHGTRHELPPLVEPDVSRDFVYVDDVVEASLLAATVGVKSARGESLNIGSGQKTTMRDVAAVARELFGIIQEPSWGQMPNRRWDLKDWYADPARANERLGWKAVTSLRAGLERTRDWVLSHGPAPKIVPTSPHGATVRLSAVIACYRDGQAIPIMHERLSRVFRELGADYEILFVNDASPDDSDRVLAEICAKDDHVIAIEHSRNFGSQSAFLSGMQVATGDAVVLLDGDLQDPPELIAEFYQKWSEGFEVVYGRRVRRETSFGLQLCYKLFYRVFRKLAYVPIPVDAGDFSLMDRKVVDQLLRLPETDQFLRGLRAWVGFKQTGVDYVRPERMFGQSTNNWIKNFWWARKAVFNFSFAPMEMLLYGGIALTALSFLALVGQVIARLLDPSIPHGISTIIILILFFGGINMLGLAVLGEYLGKIFEETKQRPKYIRRAIRIGGNALTTAAAMEEFLAGRRGEQGV